MATPKPGEIRCPTCHRSTPPAAFCTQCGSAIPPDARIRPRGMDRDELQDRIRARRSGGDPYRRGAPADEGASPYERFEPEPEDSQARRARAAADARREDHFREAAGARPRGERDAAVPPPVVPGEPPSLTRDRDDWDDRPVTSAGSAVPPTAVPPPAAPTREPVEEPEYVDNFDDARYDDEAYTYDYDEWDDERGKRSGAGAFAILGFLALGVLALLGGALLAGLFGGDGGTGQVDASPSPSASVSSASASASAAASAAPTGGETAAPSGSAAASGEPVVFPDGFTADAEPCLPGSATASGCSSNGASNSGVVDIWVGFENGNASDVVGASVIGPDGTALGTGSIDLARIGCRGQSCNGWTWFPFSNLEPGTYTVEITRNGEYASATTFEVS